MVVAARNNLGKDGGTMVGDAGMVVIQISRREVCPRAGVSRGDRGTMIEQVEGPVIVLDKISRASFAVAEGCHYSADRVEVVYVWVCTPPSQ